MSTSEVSSRSLVLNARWLLAIPLVLALAAARTFSTNWIQTLSMSPDTFAVLNALRTPNLEWVNPPFGVSLYVTPAVEMNLKLATGIRPWQWRDRPDPLPVLEAS